MIAIIAAAVATPASVPLSTSKSSERKFLKDFPAVSSEVAATQAYRPDSSTPQLSDVTLTETLPVAKGADNAQTGVAPGARAKPQQALPQPESGLPQAATQDQEVLAPTTPVKNNPVVKSSAPLIEQHEPEQKELPIPFYLLPPREAPKELASPNSLPSAAPSKVEDTIDTTRELVDQEASSPSSALLADDDTSETPRNLEEWAIDLRANIDGEQLYTFRAADLDIQKALALFARAYKLNIVPDPDVSGKITVDIHNLPLDQIMEAFLAAHGFHWEQKNELIRVHRMQTEIFTIDYPRLVRSGDGYSSASLGGASGGGSSGGSGGGGGGGGGGGSGGGGGGGASGGGGTSITQQDSIDFWAELETQLKSIASKDGK
ncbi:MAG: hypothetical protein ACI9R3_006342, partial [Verrucomicrobiales bacterium]